MNLLNSKYFGEFCAALVICALLLSQTGCAVVPGGGGINQDAYQYAETQGQKMKVHGSGFMQGALGGDDCPNGKESEKLSVRKDAYISDSNGRINFGASRNGGGSEKCKDY